VTKHLSIAIPLALSLISCQAKEDAVRPAPPTANNSASENAKREHLRKELDEKARQRNGGKEPTKLDLWNELVRKAEEVSGSVKSFGEPRVVPKGAKPEIIIKGTQIAYDGTELKIGDSFARWRAVLPPNSRCSDETREPVFCAWHSLALTVGTDLSNRTRVTYFNLYLNIEPKDPAEALFTSNPDGSPAKPLPDWSHKQPFPGYLELDGFGIDSKTEFWEIRAQADRKRNLRCGLRDCSHPHGGFSNSANLYLRLNRNDEHGNVYEFSIAGDANSEQAASSVKK